MFTISPFAAHHLWDFLWLTVSNNLRKSFILWPWFYQKKDSHRDFCKLLISNPPPPLSPQAGFNVNYVYHHFYLKATKCPKGTVDSAACQYRNDRVSFAFWFWAASVELCNGGTVRAPLCPNLSLVFCLCAFMQPLIDCAVCYKMYGGNIEQEPKPYVHCIHKPALTEVSLLLSFIIWRIKRENTLKDDMFLLFFSCSSVWQEIKQERVNHCNSMTYINGAPTLLESLGVQWTLWWWWLVINHIHVYVWTSAN